MVFEFKHNMSISLLSSFAILQQHGPWLIGSETGRGPYEIHDFSYPTGVGVSAFLSTFFSLDDPFDRTNTKNISSSYLKTDAQTIWARNAAQAQRKRTADEAFTGKEKALPNDVRSTRSIRKLSALIVI
jgi:hypothetical protein